jgi:hypothetical protein
MAQWQYCTIQLNALSLGTEEIDVLNDAGDEGWELVGITINNIAYLKRRREEKAEPVAKQWRKTASAVK